MTTAKTKPTLTEEEQKELAELEGEASDAAAQLAVDRKRQHLAALRLVKKLSALHGKRGLDFEVLETTAGNFAIRRPIDLEVDAFTQDAKDGEERLQLHAFVCALRLDPDELAFKKGLTDFPRLGQMLATAALQLTGKRVDEEGK